jgi:hypothetical protein
MSIFEQAKKHLETGVPFGYVNELEDRVKEEFDEIVRSLRFSEVALFMRRPPTDLESFRFIPIIRKPPVGITMKPMRYEYDWPEGVHHWHGLEKPYLDGRLGIGFVYEDELDAVSSGGVTAEGHIFIKQLQGLVRLSELEDKSASGLHNGVRWRESLIAAWAEVARQTGASALQMQSAINNRWVHDNREEASHSHFVAGYDRIARQLGFTLDTESMDFRLEL